MPAAILSDKRALIDGLEILPATVDNVTPAADRTELTGPDRTS